MFGKLVKHEFRATRRVIPFVFLLTVFIAIMMMLSVLLNLSAITGLTLALLIIMIVAEVTVTYVLVIWRFYRTMCGNEAYLSHTLPVRPQLLLWSKLLVSFVWVALSYLVLFLCLTPVVIIIAKGTGSSFSEITDQMKSVWDFIGFGGHEVIVIPLIIVLFSISILYGLSEFFFSVSLGSTSKMHKYGVGGPILVYLGLYFGLQVVGLIAMMIPLAVKISMTDAGRVSYSVVTKNMLQWFLDQIKNSGGAANAGQFGLGTFLVMPVIMGVLLYVTSRIVEKHTSVR